MFVFGPRNMPFLFYGFENYRRIGLQSFELAVVHGSIKALNLI